MDLNIELNLGSSKCIYQQIYEYIREEIKGGKLLHGEKLPSTRALAEFLQVSRNTVDQAYDQLLSEGYIEARERSGYFVCEIEGVLTTGIWQQPESGEAWEKNSGGQSGALWQVEKTWKAKCVQSIAEGHIQESVQKIEYDFSPHAIDMSEFPFATWKRVSKNILVDERSGRADGASLFAMGEAQGDYSLRTTISRYLHSARGVNCQPEQIIVGAGNDYLLLLLEKILGRHVPVAMENPSYKRAYRIFQSFAYPISAISMDENGMKPGELGKSGAKLAYCMPSHQFPTGAVMPIGRRLELLNWAMGEEDRYIIEDDYDSEFRYRGKPIPALQASDKGERVIYIGTFSKSIAPAIRVSYMVLPHSLLEKYREKCYFYSSTVSRIDQQILDVFIREGYFERHLNRMRKVYKEKHDTLLEAVKPLQKHFNISGENAGLHILLTDKQGRSEEKLLELAAGANIRVYGLSDAFIGEKTQQKSHTVLLGYGGMDCEEIREGAGRLCEIWG